MVEILITEKTKKILEEENKVMSSTTRVPYFPLVIDKAKGSYIYDIEGNKFIDFLSSAAVVNIGHNHPKVVNAIKSQIDKFIHYTPAYAYHKPHTELAMLLTKITPGNFDKKVAFGLSGSDSVDGALKAAKSYTGRNKIISFIGSYHGTTYGSLSVSGYSAGMHKNLGTLMPDVYFTDFPDYYRGLNNIRQEDDRCLKMLRKILTSLIDPQEVAALIFEPIQGDAGILVPSEYFINEIKTICKENEILIIADEVQTGFGRTGKMFACERYHLEPDILVLGKAIAAGMPLSAIVARKDILESWSTPQHFFNTAGNVLSCSASLENISIINDENFLNDVVTKGRYLQEELKKELKYYPFIGDFRGVGLLQGIDIVKNKDTKEKDKTTTAKICWRCWELGLILAFFSSSVLRIAPPLNIEKKDLDKAIQIIAESCEDVAKGKVSDEVLTHIKGW